MYMLTILNDALIYLVGLFYTLTLILVVVIGTIRMKDTLSKYEQQESKFVLKAVVDEENYLDKFQFVFMV